MGDILILTGTGIIDPDLHHHRRHIWGVRLLRLDLTWGLRLRGILGMDLLQGVIWDKDFLQEEECIKVRRLEVEDLVLAAMEALVVHIGNQTLTPSINNIIEGVLFLLILTKYFIKSLCFIRSIY